jgi:adenylate kinase family enzyme
MNRGHAPVRPPLQRAIVVGSSCSGKTTFARSLAGALDLPHVELDALFWNSNWVEKPHEEFRSEVAKAAAQDRWVIDGNYRSVRDLLWPRATSIIWLNFGFVTVWARACSRTFRRSVTGERLYAGNRETLSRALFSKDSILLWVLQSFHRRRREFDRLKVTGDYPDLRWIELRSPPEACSFLRTIARDRWSGAAC